LILLGHGDLVDPVDLRQRLDLITTTSPSPLMYGSIDGWRRHLALHSKTSSTAPHTAPTGSAAAWARSPAWTSSTNPSTTPRASPNLDPLKLCVDVSALGITDHQAKEWLLDEHRFAAQLGNAHTGWSAH
jgi:arginine decarboxylase